jgi:hypothetical protein
MELTEALGVQNHAEHLVRKLGHAIINDPGRQAAHKNNENTRFGRILPNDVIYSCFEGIY